MTAKESAQLCRLSKRSWFRLHACRKVPAPILIGASLRWRKEFVERWIEMSCPDRREFELRMEAEGVTNAD